MKKLALALVMAIVMSCLCAGAFALNYTGCLGNEATFETMAEVQANAPAAMQPFYARGTYAPHPAMADYPLESTYVYRSANMYGITAATRINTNLVVYTDKSFASKDEAKAYLADLGLIEIIDNAIGSIVLVTPSNPETGFTAADQKYYYALQTAMFSINTAGVVNGENVTFVDGVYYGGFSYLYVIGVDGGATFLNNYVSNTFDFVSRIAGLLLINGNMDRIRTVATFVPAYLVNAPKSVIDKYETANGVDSLRVEGKKTTTYNQVFPVRKVVTINEETPDLKSIISDAYYTFFTTAKRSQEITTGLYTAGTPYQGYSSDSAPYSLSERSAIINGVTPDGIHLFTHQEDRFADVKTADGEYLETWYEYLPEELVNGTAQPGTLPMILCCHGGGDDPRQFVDGQGFLELAGKERLVLVAPEKGDLHTVDTEGDDFMSKVMPRLVQYMLDTYPAIDASRVYVTGFSMGSLATIRTMYGAPELFAAAYPQSGSRGAEPTEEDIKHFENYDLPVIFSTSEYNMRYAENLGAGLVSLFSSWCEMNGMDPLPEADFEKYPIAGFDYDLYTKRLVNDDYVVHTFLKKNADGIPMVGGAFIESIVHCLYPHHAEIIWDFFKCYSRDQETGAIIYNPNVR